MFSICPSVSISSDSEGESVHSTGSNGERLASVAVIATPVLYTIHTYIVDRNDVIDQSFTFRLDRPVNRLFSDQIFRSIHPLSPCLTDTRSRVPIHSKVRLVKGRYKDEAGVVVGRKQNRRLHFKIVVADSSIVVVHRHWFKLLDPSNILPFGVPVPEWSRSDAH